MAKNYDYGFEISDSGGRTVIKYRQDRLWFQSGCGWWVLFSLIGFIFMLMVEPAPTPGVKPEGLPWGGIVFIGGPIVALAVMAYLRAKKREIVIDDKTVIIEGKPYDRSQIARVYAKHKQMEYNYTQNTTNYNQQSGPLAPPPTMADAIGGAANTAGQLSSGVGMAAGEAILATRQRVHIVYGGKDIVIAKGLSIQRALLLVQAIAGKMNFKGDAA